MRAGPLTNLHGGPRHPRTSPKSAASAAPAHLSLVEFKLKFRCPAPQGPAGRSPRRPRTRAGFFLRLRFMQVGDLKLKLNSQPGPLPRTLIQFTIYLPGNQPACRGPGRQCHRDGRRARPAAGPARGEPKYYCHGVCIWNPGLQGVVRHSFISHDCQPECSETAHTRHPRPRHRDTGKALRRPVQLAHATASAAGPGYGG